MTITGLRSSIVTLARGISGVACGAKSVDIPEEDMTRVHHVAGAWWTVIGEHLGEEIADADTVASAPAAIAALGAVGPNLLANLESMSDLEAEADARAKRWPKRRTGQGPPVERHRRQVHRERPIRGGWREGDVAPHLPRARRPVGPRLRPDPSALSGRTTHAHGGPASCGPFVSLVPILTP